MKKDFQKSTIILLVLFLISACQAKTATHKIPPDISVIASDYPRVDGSTSAHPLQVYMACTNLKVKCEWMPGLFSARTLYPFSDSAPDDAVETVANIWHNGTHSAYVNLINKEADFIIVARMPSEDEIREAEIKGVKLDVQPVALDAFVFLANVDNPVKSLSIEQIQDIYTGKITEWDELGGTGIINAYQRNRNSGSQELMDDLVMQGRPMIDAPDMIFEGMMGPINAIRDDPQGIGYSVFFYATFMLPDENVRLLGIEGVVPTSETIASHEYPLVAKAYAVTRENMPANSTAIMLRDWLLTDDGQDAVEESGYVPIK